MRRSTRLGLPLGVALPLLLACASEEPRWCDDHPRHRHCLLPTFTAEEGYAFVRGVLGDDPRLLSVRVEDGLLPDGRSAEWRYTIADGRAGEPRDYLTDLREVTEVEVDCRRFECSDEAEVDARGISEGVRNVVEHLRLRYGRELEPDGFSMGAQRGQRRESGWVVTTVAVSVGDGGCEQEYLVGRDGSLPEGCEGGVCPVRSRGCGCPDGYEGDAATCAGRCPGFEQRVEVVDLGRPSVLEVVGSGARFRCLPEESAGCPGELGDVAEITALGNEHECPHDAFAMSTSSDGGSCSWSRCTLERP